MDSKTDVTTLVEETVRQFVEETRASLKADLDAVRQVPVDAEQRDDEKFKAVLGLALAAAGAQPGAVDFLTNEARKVFEVKDGAVRARAGQFSRSKPYEPLTLGEWIDSQTRGKHAFAFVPLREH